LEDCDNLLVVRSLGIDEDALLPLQHLNLPLHMHHHVLLVVELVDQRCRRAL
jgi:hypothetical protein